MTPSHKTLLAQVQKALNLWKELGLQDKSLENNHYKASTISKMKNDKNPPSEQTISGFLEYINTELAKLYFEYDADSKTYKRSGNYKETPDYNALNHKGKFKSIAGSYEMFFRSSTHHIILKNILVLSADGTVKILGQGGNTYFGEAENFMHSLIAINMRNCNNEKDFYYQILLHIGNYLDVFGEKLERLYGTATTITHNNTPSATLRVLIRLKEHTQAQPCEYQENTPEYEELQSLYPNLVPYLMNNANIYPKKQANDELAI